MQEKSKRHGFVKSELPRLMFRRDTQTSQISKAKSKNQGSYKSTYEVGLRNSSALKSVEHGGKEWKNFIGQPVCISGVKEGVLRYYGQTKFADGLWCGVELKEPVGKHNGTVSGVSYFTCKPNHGIFAPVTKVALALPEKPAGILTDDQNFYRKCTRPASFHEEYENVSFLKQSCSDPTFQRSNLKCLCMNCQHNQTTWFGDKRCLTEQRELNAPLQSNEDFKKASLFSPFGKLKHFISSTSSATLLGKQQPTTRNLSFTFHKQAPVQKAKSECIFESTRNAVALQTYSYLDSNSTVKESIDESSSGFDDSVKQEKHFLKEGKSLNLKYYSDACQEEFKYGTSYSELSETKDDEDDQLSVDYDESLGILSPSQMKDFTLCGDLSTSCSEIARAVDFPSSESFDDVNELPEDEIAHDVSIQYMSACTSLVSSSVTVAQSDSVKTQHMLQELKQNVNTKPNLSRTEQFLLNVSSNTVTDVHFEIQSVDSLSSKNGIPSVVASETNEKRINISFANECVDYSDPESSTPEIYNNENDCDQLAKEKGNNDMWFNSHDLKSKESSTNQNLVEQPSANKHFSTVVQEEGLITVVQQEKCLNTVVQEQESLLKETCETAGHKSSLSSNDPDHLVFKEKVSVSWEECALRSPDKPFTITERPESIYTVSSCDTGYQDEGDYDPDGIMTTSVDSTKDNKKSSAISRDSGVIMEDIDPLKAVESASTSGYSTGLSDSYYNDRLEDEGSRPFMEDSYRDVQDSYHSDDGILDLQMVTSMDESTGGMPEKGGGFFDMDSCKDTEVSTAFQITESNTILGLDSTCKSIIEDETVFDRSVTNSDVETKIISLEKNNVKTQENAQKCEISNDASPKDSFYPVEDSKSKDVQSSSVSKNTKTEVSVIAISEKTDFDAKKQILKSPKKKVMSKIKAAIENSANRVSNRNNKVEALEQDAKIISPKKRSRWSSVTSKIASSLADEKTKPKVKKEVKGKVDTNLSAARQACKSPKSEHSSQSGNATASSPTFAKPRRPMSDTQRYGSSCNHSTHVARVDQSPQSPRHMQRLLSLMAGCAPVCRMAYVIHTPPGPGKTSLSSRSASPVAVSESSTTSVTTSSHHSRSKIAVWKGSNNAVSAPVPVPPPQVKKPFMGGAFKLMNRTSRVQNKDIARETTVDRTNSRDVNVGKTVPPRIMMRPEPTTATKPYGAKLKTAKEQHEGGRPIVPPKPVRPPMWLSKAELTQEIQHLSSLCECRTKELNRLKMQTKHVTRGFDALAVAIQYMADDLHVFENPNLLLNLKQTQEKVNKEKKDLECYEKKIAALNTLHAKEMNELLETLTTRHESELQELLLKHTTEINFLREQHKNELVSFTEALQASCEEERLQQEKLIADLQKELKQQREEVEMFHQQELDDLEERYQEKQNALKEEIRKLQKQLSDAKQTSFTMEETMQKDTDSKLHWLSEKKNDLQNEVDSLKAVLEIKNNELHSLRKENLEMQKEVEELPLAKERIKMLHARAEDLQALMSEKVQLERQLSTEHKILTENYEKEAKVNKRLSMENEELQWRLKQVAEQSLLSHTTGDMSETNAPVDEESCNFDEELPSPVKCSTPISSSKPMFFTYMNDEEVALSSHSPRMHYKQIKPCSSSHRPSSAKSVKSTSSPSPRKCKGSADSSPHCGGGTPRKMAKHLNRAAQRSSVKKKLSSSTDTKTQDGNVHESLEINVMGLADSLVSSASSDNSVFEPCLLEEHGEEIRETLKLLQEQNNTEFIYDVSSPTFDSNEKWHLPIGRSESATTDQNISLESVDPKTFYHVAFPVMRDTETTAEEAEIASKELSE